MWASLRRKQRRWSSRGYASFANWRSFSQNCRKPVPTSTARWSLMARESHLLKTARIVAAGKSKDDWIPAPVALGEPCPLSEAEVRELYATNSSTLLDDDRNVDYPLPETSDLLPPLDVERAIQQLSELAENAQPDQRHWPAVTFTSHHIQGLSSLIADLRSAVGEFATVEGWRLAALDAGRNLAPGPQPMAHSVGKDRGDRASRHPNRRSISSSIAPKSMDNHRFDCKFFWQMNL